MDLKARDLEARPINKLPRTRRGVDGEEVVIVPYFEGLIVWVVVVC
jgi:hypothetical protein